MSDFPKAIDVNRAVIHVGSPESIGIPVAAFAQQISTSTTWPAANLALFIPFLIGSPTIITQMFWINGTTVGTNHVDVGIYNIDGVRLINSGSILTAGASAIQAADITDTPLQSGVYYMAMAMDGTTDTFIGNTAVGGITIGVLRAIGMYEQATAFTLPSSATFAVCTHTLIPLLGLTTKTVI